MSIYSTATIGQPDNQVTFNDFNNSPVYRVQSRAARQFQIRADDIPVPFESGVSDFKTLVGQTNYVIQGVMYPADENGYDQGLQALRAVSSLDLEQNDPANTDEGYVPYTWGDASGQKTLFVKVLYASITENTRQGYVQPFILYCKVKDPTIYGSVLKQASTAQSNTSTSTGAAKYAFAYPISFGSTLYTVSADANNIGQVPAYPNSIQVFGPVNTPTITNTKTGEFITVNVSLASSSDSLLIIYDKDTLKVTLNGVSVVGKVTTSSTYFKIHPGDNIIQLSGASVSTGAYAVVSYRDAYALA